MINRWQSHSSWLEWLDPSSWSSIRGRGTPQTGGNLLDTCCFLFYTLVTVVFLSLHVLCIILQGSGLGLVALWPNLCFAQGATVEFFSHELLHSYQLCLIIVIFSTTMLFMLSTRCTLERRLSFLESSQLLAPLPSSPPRPSTTPTPS